MNRIKIEIPPEFDVKENDYNNKIEKEMKFNNSYNGSINFKKIPITYLNNDCKLLAFLNNYLRHNKLEKMIIIFITKKVWNGLVICIYTKKCELILIYIILNFLQYLQYLQSIFLIYL